MAVFGILLGWADGEVGFADGITVGKVVGVALFTIFGILDG